MLTKKLKKTHFTYCCEKCDFSTSNKNDYTRHLSTGKHQMLTNVDKKTQKNSKPFQCDCGKQYKHRQSLFVHKKKCKIIEQQQQLQDINENGITTEMFVTLMNQNTEIIKENCKLQNTIHDIVPKIGNNNKMISNTNNFNINIFLNENCKDALNITEFVESLKLQLDDLMYSRQNGAIEGISNVLIKGLNELEIEKRPLHCTDVKRETLYIKDENGWEKENKDKEKLKKAIFTTQQRQARLIQDWQNENPDWADSMAKMEEFHQFVQKVYMDDGEENKVIKNIAKNVHIDPKKIENK